MNNLFLVFLLFLGPLSQIMTLSLFYVVVKKQKKKKLFFTNLFFTNFFFTNFLQIFFYSLFLNLDGITDVLSAQGIIDYVNNKLEEGHKKEDISKLLCEHAIEIGSHDNCSSIILFRN